MREDEIQRDLLFCKPCATHFGGQKRQCPHCGTPLGLVEAFEGRPGDVVDERYRLLDLIGVGGMGSVFRAHDRITNRDVAVKLLNTKYASHAASARRFFGEARMLRMVNHRAVAALHRFGPTPNGMLIIDMEFVPGESVRERVVREGGGVDMIEGLEVLDGLLAALAACHDAGVVHCDVKPENVMLIEAGGGRCKLIDFGIAQQAGEVEQGDDFVVLGTPAFMSPEQVRGRAVDARTDLYLVGCVAYELLTGEPPFCGASPIDLCHQQMLTEPPLLSDRIGLAAVPAGLQAWVQGLLEKSPDRRPESTRVVREQLRMIRSEHRKSLADAARRVRSRLRPPSVPRIKRDTPPHLRGAALRGAELQPKNAAPVPSLRTFIEVRQVFDDGTLYGPNAIQEIVQHVLAGTLQELRELGACVAGPVGPHIEVRLRCEGDERGAISHLLDVLARMNAQLERIPEPNLEIRAAVLSQQPHEPVDFGGTPQLDLVGLLNVGPGSQVRVDERVARWAGHRPIVRLASFREPGQELKTLYATALVPTA
jgi:serine/threonine protein kinase